MVELMTNLRALLMGTNPSDELRLLHNSGELAAYLPEVAALNLNDQHSHKHKNNLYHSFLVLEHAIELEDSGPDLILRTAALLHDIGKPATRRIIDGKATFRNHETVGAKQVRAILKRENYTNDEAKKIQELIANHMRSFGFQENLWTDSAVRRLANDIQNEVQLRRLFAIFKADVTTKHADRRRAIWNKADVLWARIEEVLAKDKRAALRPAINGNEIMEILDLKPGKVLGAIMKFLNTDEGVSLSRDEAIARAREILASN